MSRPLCLIFALFENSCHLDNLIFLWWIQPHPLGRCLYVLHLLQLLFLSPQDLIFREASTHFGLKHSGLASHLAHIRVEQHLKPQQKYQT